MDISVQACIVELWKNSMPWSGKNHALHGAAMMLAHTKDYSINDYEDLLFLSRLAYQKHLLTH